jgi:hypothetical protein
MKNNMKEFTAEEIQAKFKTLPPELKEAISSPEVNEKIVAIGKKHNLMIDQIGALVDQIGLVMLGFSASSNFVRDASGRLSLSETETRKIADDINREIFSTIKMHMRELEEKKQTEDTARNQDLRALEQAGGFSVDREPEVKTGRFGNVSSDDKAKILSGIENPVQSKEAPSQKNEQKKEPKSEPTNNDRVNKEPLSDYLLKAAGRDPEKMPVAEKIAEQKPAPAPLQPRTGPDAYREPPQSNGK